MTLCPACNKNNTIEEGNSLCNDCEGFFLNKNDLSYTSTTKTDSTSLSFTNRTLDILRTYVAAQQEATRELCLRIMETVECNKETACIAFHTDFAKLYGIERIYIPEDMRSRIYISDLIADPETFYVFENQLELGKTAHERASEANHKMRVNHGLLVGKN